LEDGTETRKNHMNEPFLPVLFIILAVNFGDNILIYRIQYPSLKLIVNKIVRIR